MNIITKEWQTLEELKENTGINADTILETIKGLFKSKKVEVLFSTHGLKYKLRDWKAWGLKTIC